MPNTKAPRARTVRARTVRARTLRATVRPATALAKRAVALGLSRLSLELHRTDPAVPARGTQAGSLAHLVRLGAVPRTVIDVGAAGGTPAVQAAFPQAKHLLVEPLVEFRDRLGALAATLADAEVVLAAAGASEGHIVLNVHPDLFGSSPLLEAEKTDVNGFTRTVRQTTVDAMVREAGAAGPYFLKVDTQGYELAVLDGASHVLTDTLAVLLEVSLFQFFTGGPQLAEVVSAMFRRGFVVYDVIDHAYRPLDGALAQADIVFVPESGPLRRHHEYATAEQRRALTEQLRASL